MSGFRNLKPEEIECRVQQVKAVSRGFGCVLLLYKDARCDMAILDEAVGMGNWQRRHEEHAGNLFCSVGVKLENGWIWKEDAGAPSNTEAEKGHASDSFKRACVNWGIGRELYTAPFIWVNLAENEVDNPKGKPKLKFKVRFRVREISYDDKRRISALTIVDQDGNVRYSYANGKTERVNMPQRPSEEAPRQPEPPKGDIYCSICGGEIEPRTAGGHTYSVDEIIEGAFGRYGRPLCWDCMKNAKKQKANEDD